LPVFSQATSAACTREVSSVVVGVFTSTAVLVNWAESVWQADGVVGCETERLSPVARVCAESEAGKRVEAAKNESASTEQNLFT
jgi:hypothetical protein